MNEIEIQNANQIGMHCGKYSLIITMKAKVEIK